MLVSDFDFDLPPELIATHPPKERDGARMLRLHRDTSRLDDGFFRDLTGLLRPGDMVVMNNSRVIPSRLYGRRAGLRTQTTSAGPSGLIEVLLTEQVSDQVWNALVKPGRKIQRGETLYFGNGEHVLTAEVVEQSERGQRTLRFYPAKDFFAELEALGHVPLPPYLHRADTAEDRARYQTVYADPAQPGSAAAPTAGLHFTPRMLDEMQRMGVHTAYLTLHVGLGTFQPVSVERVEDIRLHAEHYTLTADTAAAINRAKAEGRRVIAVGTTTVRTLEHCARQANASVPDVTSKVPSLYPHSGSTSIFLKPGDPFLVVDALLTNFHLPKSTLLMLVAAFAAQGREPQAGTKLVMHAYFHAVRERYRFFSYGDCMFLT